MNNAGAKMAGGDKSRSQAAIALLLALTILVAIIPKGLPRRLQGKGLRLLQKAGKSPRSASMVRHVGKLWCGWPTNKAALILAAIIVGI